MITKTFGRLAGAILITLAVAACGTSASETGQQAGRYVDDATISTKVRAAIIEDKSVSIRDIDVETYKSTVQLSGFVDSLAVKNRAGAIASSVEGVRKVQNNLVVK